MYIDKSTIYFSNGKQFCGKTIVLPRILISKLPDYFIQWVRNASYFSYIKSHFKKNITILPSHKKIGKKRRYNTLEAIVFMATTNSCAFLD
jgi:hypothetical protein